MGTLIQAGVYAPTTVNTWLAILRVVMKAAVREFLAALKELFPQHCGMAFLGLATGRRPSSLRPLRRQGPECDLLLEEGKLRVLRSHTRGDNVMNSTKQKTRYTIDLPPEAVEVLRWHIRTQLELPTKQDCDLLFPSINGTFRKPTMLNKPFAAVSDAIGLGYHFTQRGMRRTFNDLMRAAQVEAIVTRSISGHLTVSSGATNRVYSVKTAGGARNPSPGRIGTSWAPSPAARVRTTLPAYAPGRSTTRRADAATSRSGQVSRTESDASRGDASGPSSHHRARCRVRRSATDRDFTPWPRRFPLFRLRMQSCPSGVGFPGRGFVAAVRRTFRSVRLVAEGAK